MAQQLAAASKLHQHHSWKRKPVCNLRLPAVHAQFVCMPTKPSLQVTTAKQLAAAN
jgi:hypothetical protein